MMEMVVLVVLEMVRNSEKDRRGLSVANVAIFATVA